MFRWVVSGGLVEACPTGVVCAVERDGVGALLHASEGAAPLDLHGGQTQALGYDSPGAGSLAGRPGGDTGAEEAPEDDFGGVVVDSAAAHGRRPALTTAVAAGAGAARTLAVPPQELRDRFRVEHVRATLSL